ncbi:MAG: hypothetical protein M1830_000750 [Pleopsidium flavum]|nr:MAG: hypothetical protein M1830_000750 [Pleopsidium flavum]
MNLNSSLPPMPLPSGITERQVHSDASELSYHILEAGGTPARDRPLLLLLHGFPEIAYSWRKVMPQLADAGCYVVAFDQRGFGRTAGWDTAGFGKVDLRTFSTTNMVRDVIVLVYALGYKHVKSVVGHDFGAVTASLCALTRPDFFESVILMSHPFKGSPSLPFNIANDSSQDNDERKADIHMDLANLPEPRKHYKWYYSTLSANEEMTTPREGLHDFLRGYFHLKSADWKGNEPQPLTAWTATELAKMPYYYIMPLHSGMREAVAKDMAQENHQEVEKKSSRWLPEADLKVYAQEYERTGFQGGLNWYRVQTDPSKTRELDMFAGKKIEIPCLFISGSKDWGIYQEPGVVERMSEVCSDFRGVEIIEDAGHWVQQEQPQRVVEEILGLLRSL